MSRMKRAICAHGLLHHSPRCRCRITMSMSMSKSIPITMSMSDRLRPLSAHSAPTQRPQRPLSAHSHNAVGALASVDLARISERAPICAHLRPLRRNRGRKRVFIYMNDCKNSTLRYARAYSHGYAHSCAHSNRAVGANGRKWAQRRKAAPILNLTRFFRSKHSGR